MEFDYDDIITELDCVGDQLCLLCNTIGESKDRSITPTFLEVVENAIHAVECHVHRISCALGEYTGSKKTNKIQ